MEEAESLVDTKRSMTQSDSNLSGNNSSARGLTQTWLQRNYLVKIVLVAALAILFVLFLSGTGQNQVEGNSQAKNHSIGHVIGHGVANEVASPVEAVAPAETPTAPEPDAQREPNPINVYSKFATVQPLRHFPLPDQDTANKLTEKWGHWHFWDGEEDERPTDDFLSKYPNKDVPTADFPERAWQADAVFVNHFLMDAGNLVARAMEAIYAEYGYSSDQMSPEDLAERPKRIFHWVFSEGMDISSLPGVFQSKRTSGNKGGWMPKRSHDGLIRRLLHAIMTSDTFTVVLGGHSVAAGAGNKFQQNYAMQFHKVMAPVFARLGVKLITRNMAQGGLGTIQASLGMSSIYGDDIDLLLWDAGMTEGAGFQQEFFFRQGLIGGKRVPMVMGEGMNLAYMGPLYDLADADVGQLGRGIEGMPLTIDAEQALTIPYATRFLNCAPDAKDYCAQQPRFCTVCWIDPLGDGSIVPPTPQKEFFSDNTNFHPGWRELQVRGRSLAMMVLRALRDAIDLWTENVAGGPPLDESFWHVTDYYDNIRTKLLNHSKEWGTCHQTFQNLHLPPRLCDAPMKGATEYTPRQNPHMTSIAAMAKPAPDGSIPVNLIKPVWEGPEPPDPCLQIPEGEVDVYSIITGRRRLERDTNLTREKNNIIVPPRSSFPGPSNKETAYHYHGEQASSPSNTSRRLDTGIVPGRGWEITGAPIGNCDGTFDTDCNFGDKSDCLFSNYNSGRGAVTGNEFSGWLVLNIPEIKVGVILLKIDAFYKNDVNKITGNWTSVNNERRKSRHRELNGYSFSRQPETMVFEYAINGQITTLPRDEFLRKLTQSQLQRVVWVLPLLDDENFTGTDVEVAIRMRGCGRECTYGFTHIYWA